MLETVRHGALAVAAADAVSRWVRRCSRAHPEIAEIRLSCPNKHHFLVDLSAWDLDNPKQVFYAADRPYGLIEASVIRDDAGDAAEADAIWAGAGPVSTVSAGISRAVPSPGSEPPGRQSRRLPPHKREGAP